MVTVSNIVGHSAKSSQNSGTQAPALWRVSSSATRFLPSQLKYTTLAFLIFSPRRDTRILRLGQFAAPRPFR